MTQTMTPVNEGGEEEEARGKAKERIPGRMKKFDDEEEELKVYCKHYESRSMLQAFRDNRKIGKCHQDDLLYYCPVRVHVCSLR